MRHNIIQFFNVWGFASFSKIIPYRSFGDTIPVPTVSRVHFLSPKLWYITTSFGWHAFLLDIFWFSWEEKLVALLIAAPNGEMRKWEDKGTEHKCLTTGYMCNCNAKEITILFCKQIGRSLNMSFAKCRMGLREGKMEMAGNGFSSCPIFVS